MCAVESVQKKKKTGHSDTSAKDDICETDENIMDCTILLHQCSQTV